MPYIVYMFNQAEYMKEWRKRHPGWQKEYRKTHSPKKYYVPKSKKPKEKEAVVKKSGTIYWGNIMDDHFTAYVKETDAVKKSEIYETYLQTPLLKMAENIYNRWKFQYFEGMNPRNVMKDAVTHTISNIGGYDKAKGKSFSLCSIIMRNWMMNTNNANYKHMTNTISLDEPQPTEEPLIETIKIATEYDQKGNAAEVSAVTDKLFILWAEMYNFYKEYKFPKNNEIAVKILDATNAVLSETNNTGSNKLYQKMTGMLYDKIGTRTGIDSLNIGITLRALAGRFLRAKYTEGKPTPRTQTGSWGVIDDGRRLYKIHRNEILNED